MGVALIIATPIFTILYQLSGPVSDTWRHLYETVLADYVQNSVLLMAGTALLAALFGVLSAWLTSMYDFAGRRFFEWALILPLAIPSYISAYTYAGFLDYAGPLQVFLRESFDYRPAPGALDIMHLPGAVLVLASVLYPYVYVTCRGAFLNQSVSLLEASRSLGAGGIRTFWRVALPVARPALVGGLTLVVMEVLNDYGAVKYFGVPTFTTGIFRAWFSLGDQQSAIYLSSLLLLFVLGLIGLERWQRGSARFHPRQSHARPLRRVRPGAGLRILYTILCALPFVLGFVIPVGMLLYWAVIASEKAFDANFLPLISNSFWLAGTAALLICAISILLAYSRRIEKSRLIPVMTRVATSGYSIPGAVIAVGVLIPLLWLDKGLFLWAQKALSDAHPSLLLTGSVFALLFAYHVRFMAVGFQPIDAGFTQVGQQVTEVSQSLGAGKWRTLLQVNLPLLRRAVLGGLILVFVDVLKELPLTLILRPFNFNTLATRAYELAADELLEQSAGAALMIILVGLIPVLFLNRIIRKSHDSHS